MTTAKNLVEIPGDPRFVVRGSAQVRFQDSGKFKGLFVVSAENEQGRRVDVDSAGDAFLVSGVADLINDPAPARF